MVGKPIERDNVSAVGFHDLDGRPAFKYRVDERELRRKLEF